MLLRCISVSLLPYIWKSKTFNKNGYKNNKHGKIPISNANANEPCKERNKTLIDFDCDDSWENVKILMLNIFTRRVREI